MFAYDDDLPQLEFPWLTSALIAVCSLIFIGEEFMSPRNHFIFELRFGCIPAVFTGHYPPGSPYIELGFGHMHGAMTLLTSAFLHAGWTHLIGNMLFLWVFGRHIEDSMGRLGFVIFVVICSITSSLVQVLSHPSSVAIGLGASGFISGMMGAYLALFPFAKMRMVLWAAGRLISFQVPALLYLGLWIAFQAIFATHPAQGPSDIAFWAHVGGFVTGAVLAWALNQLGVIATYADGKAVG